MKIYYLLGKDIKFCYQRREIQANSEVTKLGGRESNILLLLLEYPNVILSKSFINERVWGDVLVAETSLTKAISNIRKAFSNYSNINCELKTFSKQGYMLVMENNFEETSDVTNDSELKNPNSLMENSAAQKLRSVNSEHHTFSFWSTNFLQMALIAFSTSIITVTAELIAFKLHLF
ncbi:winged helix-turn-helix domain-containing protein [Vibrio hyugaensis]|uniref:winged helix-turn-helix domain-containing protein n=1 Tax=Vibrio hyugaensis TaxID=1534743 RepID=UPI00069483E1|nr:winged helix-turn-helix domain-containing protein [Vibrio hyugaensis]